MILWAESFDYLGTGATSETNMLKGLWAAFVGGSTNISVDGGQSRTGNYSLRIGSATFISSMYSARRVIGSTKTVVGIGYGFYATALPAVNGSVGMGFRTPSNTVIASLRTNSDGSLSVYDSAGTLLVTSDPVLTATAWNHIEAKILVDNVVGEIEVRVNQATVIHGTNLDFGSTGCNQISFQHFTTSPGDASGTYYYFDDIVVWDDTGSLNNDFLGPQRVLTIFPSVDTAQADFQLSGAASGYDCINDTVPDDDTTHLFTENIGDISEFELPDLPPETANIIGVYIPNLSKLSDAGIGNLQVSMVSGSDIAAGADNVLTAAYTYRGDVFETDPATDALWTKSGLEAAILKIEKTG